MAPLGGIGRKKMGYAKKGNKLDLFKSFCKQSLVKIIVFS